MKPSILLTGGRGPATLEMVRLLGRAGYRIWVADSIPRYRCQDSRWVERAVVLPEAAADPRGFIQGLKKTLQEGKIDVLLPTYEDIFYVAWAKPELAALCEVWCADLAPLDRLHHKIRFVEWMGELGLSVPPTVAYDGAWTAELDGFLTQYQRVVIKPAYSRFAAQTRVNPADPRALLKQLPVVRGGWVVQAFVPGTEICSFSFVAGGTVRTHTQYPSLFRVGAGAAVAFGARPHSQVEAWVREFARKTGFRGHVAFDFIIPENGNPVAIECNPRLTSGLHLFRGQREYISRMSAGWRGEPSDAAPLAGRGTITHLLPMLLLGLSLWKKPREGWRWLKTLLGAGEATWMWSDPRPFPVYFAELRYFIRLAKQKGISPHAAWSQDMDWSGIPSAGH